MRRKMWRIVFHMTTELQPVLHGKQFQVTFSVIMLYFYLLVSATHSELESEEEDNVEIIAPPKESDSNQMENITPLPMQSPSIISSGLVNTSSIAGMLFDDSINKILFRIIPSCDTDPSAGVEEAQTLPSSKRDLTLKNLPSWIGGMPSVIIPKQYRTHIIIGSEFIQSLSINRLSEEVQDVKRDLAFLSFEQAIPPASYGGYVRALDIYTDSIIQRPFDLDTIGSIPGLWQPLHLLGGHEWMMTLGIRLEHQQLMMTNCLAWDWLDNKVLASAQQMLSSSSSLSISSQISWLHHLTWRIHGFILNRIQKWSLTATDSIPSLPETQKFQQIHSRLPPIYEGESLLGMVIITLQTVLTSWLQFPTANPSFYQAIFFSTVAKNLELEVAILIL